MQNPNTRLINHISRPLEIKGLKDREFNGHGSIFGNVDLGGDIVVPGAFEDSLKYHKEQGFLPAMFWMHKPDKVPGKWLSIEEDDKGLANHGVLAPTPLGDEMHVLLGMKAVRGLSIGYETLKQAWDDFGNRMIIKANLWETSIVSLAMNPLAQVVNIKSQLSKSGEFVPSIREFESILRDVGCAQNVAKRIIAKVYDGEDKPDDHRDGEQETVSAAEKLIAELFIASIQSKLPRF